MEKLFGKRVMKKVDELLKEEPKEPEKTEE
jgi:hypothetical protein